MTTIPALKTARQDWRLFFFRLIGVLIAVGLFLLDGMSVLAPWYDLAGYDTPAHAAAIQRWYDARWGAYAGILFSGSLLALLWRPRAQPLLLQFLISSGIVLAALEALFAPLHGLVYLAIVGLLAIAYPNRAGLLRLTRSGPLSRPLLALSLLAAALLGLDIWRSIALDLAAGSSQLLARHAIEASALALAGLLAATRRPGWQALGLLTGVALIYLGLAAAKLPAQAYSWGAASAALATLGGWGFVGLTALEARRAGKQRAKWNSATNLIPK
ncbi:MAG TPA: hypothetical protein VFU22_11135 [Roseiflexaceae bacterium]|nr:hypothetical protein [Roseiflexaceae bacterium]